MCFVAVAEGDLETLKRMHTEQAADLHTGDAEEGDTPFGVACRFGHLEMAQWMV